MNFLVYMIVHYINIDNNISVYLLVLLSQMSRMLFSLLTIIKQLQIILYIIKLLITSTINNLQTYTNL